MIRSIIVLLALLLAAGPEAEAQDRQGQRAPEAGPIQLLLQLRSEINLTADQIAHLERIDADMDRLNGPLVAQMSAIRAKIRELGPVESMSPRRRAAFEAYLAEARPLMDEIQQNNSVAMQRVGAVLTEAQRQWIAEQLREREENSRERNARFPRFPGRGN
jgi:Spy/CpxP family protein refolding chaperone